jgi:hypothetical protein
MGISPKQITVEVFEYKLDGDVNKFLIATIFEFLVVSNAIFANESTWFSPK